jgi:hypothetical protein
MAKKISKQESKYKVTVVRFYNVVDTIEVDATSMDNAETKAREISAKKDYTGRFDCEEVMVMETEKIK